MDSITIAPGPHGGFWIKDGDKVVMWAYKMEIAEQRLEEMSQ